MKTNASMVEKINRGPEDSYNKTVRFAGFSS